MINDMINILRICVIGAMAQGEVEERRIMGPSILTFSELDSGKSLVITKNNLIDVFFRLY